MDIPKRCSWISLTCVASLLFVSGCVEDLELQPLPEERAFPLFDPATGVIPLPNSAVISAETGLLQVPVADEETQPAQATFDKYLNTLDGFPIITPATACFSADVDESTLQAGVKVLLLPSGESETPTDISDQVQISEPEQTLECPVMTTTSCDPTAAQTGCAEDQLCVATSSNVATLGTCANAGYMITITPPNSMWERGRSYALFITDDVTDADGNALIPAVNFAIASGENPLCAWSETLNACEMNFSAPLGLAVAAQVKAEQPNLSGADLDLAIGQATLASATSLELLRQGLSALITASGIERDKIVVAWSFKTVSMVEALFDLSPTNTVIPGPGNDIVYDVENNRVNIPISSSDDAATQLFNQGLNTLDGFSTTASAVARFSGALDAASLDDDAQLLLLEVGTGSLTPTAATFAYVDTADAITVTPVSPLKEQTRYLIVMTSNRVFEEGQDGSEQLTAAAGTTGLAGADGKRVVPSPTFALARSSSPLVDDDDKSTVSALDDATAALLEALRTSYNLALSGLSLSGIEREDVVQMWSFRTQSVTKPLIDLRAAAYSGLSRDDGSAPNLAISRTVNDPTPCTVAAVENCWPGQQTSETMRIGTWVSGTFTAWNALDPKTGAFVTDPANHDATESVPFELTIPEGTAPTDGWPIVVFQHGLTASKEVIYAIANTLAKSRVATIAFDAIYHGDRTVCSSDDHCLNTDTVKSSCNLSKSPAQCCLVSDEDNCSPLYLARNAQTGIPLASGNGFIDPSNPFAIRDTMRQHVLDAVALLRAIKLGALTAYNVDAMQVHYLGHSLGANLGVPLAAVDPIGAGSSNPLIPEDVVSRVTLVTGGAPLVQSFTESDTASFQQMVAGIFAAKGVSAGSAAALELLYILQWVLDPIDPVNFAPYLKKAALSDAVASQLADASVTVPAKTVMQLIATDDAVIPPVRQQLLAAGIGVDTTNTTYETSNHSFLFLQVGDDPVTLTAAAQVQVGVFFATGDICEPNTTNGACN